MLVKLLCSVMLTPCEVYWSTRNLGAGSEEGTQQEVNLEARKRANLDSTGAISILRGSKILLSRPLSNILLISAKYFKEMILQNEQQSFPLSHVIKQLPLCIFDWQPFSCLVSVIGPNIPLFCLYRKTLRCFEFTGFLSRYQPVVSLGLCHVGLLDYNILLKVA